MTILDEERELKLTCHFLQRGLRGVRKGELRGADSRELALALTQGIQQP